MKKPRPKIILIAIVLFALFSALFYYSLPVNAGTLTNIKDRLNRQIENLTSGVFHTFVFTTELPVSGGAGNNQVRIDLPVADDGLWCNTVGTLTATGCAEDGALPLPGTLSASCAQSNDIITVTGVDNLLAAIAYCVQIDDTGTGSLGTPIASTTGLITVTTNNGLADVDSKLFAVDIVTDDQITVIAQVGAPGGGGGGGGGGASPTEVIFTGKSYANRPVTLLKNAQVVASAMADIDGDFEIKLRDIAAGQYIFSVYAEDLDGRKSPLLSFSVIIYLNITTYIGGIYIGPTIDTNKIEVAQDGTIDVFGYTIPGADAMLFINSGGKQFSTYLPVDNAGRYYYSLNASGLSLGDASLFVKAYYQNMELGSMSRLISFIVGVLGSEDIFRRRPACPEIGDFNSDCQVNLIDLSILIYWLDRFNPPTTVDLNLDRRVDLTDFSILTYYWTG